MTVSERVEAGANWLDEVFPDGWIDKIDLDDLEMESSCSCILGQLAPDDPWFNDDNDPKRPYNRSNRFWSWIYQQPQIPESIRDQVPAIIDVSTAESYGFMAKPDWGWTDGDSWDDLQEAWIELIKKEREEKANV